MKEGLWGYKNLSRDDFYLESGGDPLLKVVANIFIRPLLCLCYPAIFILLKLTDKMGFNKRVADPKSEHPLADVLRTLILLKTTVGANISKKKELGIWHSRGITFRSPVNILSNFELLKKSLVDSNRLGLIVKVPLCIVLGLCNVAIGVSVFLPATIATHVFSPVTLLLKCVLSVVGNVGDVERAINGYIEGYLNRPYIDRVTESVVHGILGIHGDSKDFTSTLTHFIGGLVRVIASPLILLFTVVTSFVARVGFPKPFEKCFSAHTFMHDLGGPDVGRESKTVESIAKNGFGSIFKNWKTVCASPLIIVNTLLDIVSHGILVANNQVVMPMNDFIHPKEDINMIGEVAGISEVSIDDEEKILDIIVSNNIGGFDADNKKDVDTFMGTITKMVQSIAKDIANERQYDSTERIDESDVISKANKYLQQNYSFRAANTESTGTANPQIKGEEHQPIVIVVEAQGKNAGARARSSSAPPHYLKQYQYKTQHKQKQHPVYLSQEKQK